MKAWLLVATLLGAGCARVPPESPASPEESLIFVRPPVARATGQPSDVDVLARGFVKGEAALPRGYGYYVYLLFRDDTQETRSSRLAAAQAFLERTEDPRLAPVPANGPVMGPAKMALLVAPIKGRTRPRSASELVEEYNYLTGPAWHTRVRRHIKGLAAVAIVGSPVPFAEDSTIDAERLRVANLCADEQSMRRAFRLFEERLLLNDDEVTMEGFSILDTMGEIFDALGDLIAVSVGNGPSDAPCAR